MADPRKEAIQHIPISDIVSQEGIILKKYGGLLKACCPFHKEKTPSFTVTDSRGTFKCFGCGKGGTAIDFVMRHKNFSYNEALLHIASRNNIILRSTPRTEKEKKEGELRDILYAIYADAASLYRENLHNDQDAQDYLRNKRKLQDKSIEEWGIGLSGGRIHQRLTKKYPLDALLASGVIGKSNREDGDHYDYFWDNSRIIFPISNNNGKIIGFAGRTLLSKEELNKAKESGKPIPKFINSKESPIYSKKEILYGLDKAHEHIGESKQVFIVEGYLDAIALHQAGIKNTVATAGTSLTQQHVEKLERIIEKATICFDADLPGRNRACDAGLMFMKPGVPVSIMDLGGGDPDEFVDAHGVDGFYSAAMEGKDVLEFALDVEGFQAIEKTHKKYEYPNVAKRLFRFVDASPSPYQKQLWLEEIAQQLSAPLTTMQKEYIRHLKVHSRKGNGIEITPQEDEVIGFVAVNSWYRDEAAQRFSNYVFSEEIYRDFFDYVCHERHQDDSHNAARMNVQEIEDVKKLHGPLFAPKKIESEVMGLVDSFRKSMADEGIQYHEGELNKLRGILLTAGSLGAQVNDPAVIKRMACLDVCNKLQYLESQLTREKDAAVLRELKKAYQDAREEYRSISM